MSLQAANLLVSSVGVPGILLSILTSTLLCWFVQWKLSRRHLYDLAAKNPYPDDLTYFPVVGHALNFLGGTEKILASMLRATKDSVYPRTVWLAYRLFYIMVRPEDMEVVLNSCKTLQKDDLYRFSIPLVGHGLFNLEVKDWKIHRKAIATTFNQKILDQFVEAFVEQAKVMTELLKQEVGKEFDGFDYIGRCALDSVLGTSMGVKLDCQREDRDKLHEKISRGMEIMMLRMFNVPFHSNFLFNLTSYAKEEQRIVQSYSDIVRKIVVQTKNSYRKKKLLIEESVESDFEVRRSKNAFLDHLIHLSEEETKFTDQEIIDEVRTFIIAGADTSSVTIAFVLTCLAIHPEFQQKVYEEIVDVVGETRDIEHADLPKLRYLEMAIKETMRLFPVGPNIVRKVEEDLHLETCTMPKGSGVVLSILSLHRSPQYYKDPMVFNPDRFSPEETSKRHPYAYLPFAGGPRNCIGMKYGMMLVKCIVASNIRKFQFESSYRSVQDIRVKQSLLIAAVEGHKFRITPRDNF